MVSRHSIEDYKLPIHLETWQSLVLLKRAYTYSYQRKEIVEQFDEDFQDRIVWLKANIPWHQIRHINQSIMEVGASVLVIALYVRTPADLMLYKLRWYKPT